MSHCLFSIVYITLLAYSGFCQDVVYPKIEEAPYLSGNNPVITERIPVYIPERCPENMLLYPGPGDKSSWICDCRPGYVYSPYNETCDKPFTRGPCPEDSYVYVHEGGNLPICVANPCANVPYDRVPYNGKCYNIGSTDQEPCGKNSSIFVNIKTFQIECKQLPAILPTELLITAPKLTPNPCPNKGHRVKGVCRCPIN